MEYYKINLINSSKQIIDGYLEEANQHDMPPIDEDWSFHWRDFWTNVNWDCENIVKLHSQEKILGLIHFAAYPYLPNTPSDPEYIEILHLQCIKKNKRFADPIGFWLIWYATNFSLERCQGNSEKSFVILDSTVDSISYYQDKVMMEGKGWVNLAPGEDGYAFRFTEEEATNFCTRIEGKYGSPKLINQ